MEADARLSTGLRRIRVFRDWRAKGPFSGGPGGPRYSTRYSTAGMISTLAKLPSSTIAATRCGSTS